MPPMRKGISLVMFRPALRDCLAESGNVERVRSLLPEVHLSLPPVWPPLPKSQWTDSWSLRTMWRLKKPKRSRRSRIEKIRRKRKIGKIRRNDVSSQYLNPISIHPIYKLLSFWHCFYKVFKWRKLRHKLTKNIFLYSI